MLALATSIKIQAKIDEKSHVFWNFDFERILGGFWEGFGRPKSSIFALFSMFFRCHFSSAVRKSKKPTKMGQQDTESDFLELGSGDPQAPGERKRIGVRTSQIEMRERTSREASCDC